MKAIWSQSSVVGSHFIGYSKRNKIVAAIMLFCMLRWVGARSNEELMTNFQVSCQIQEIPENGADVAHLAAIHKDLALLGGEPNGWITKATGLISWHDWTVSWKGRTL